jgi:hypothetical protein
MLAMWGWLLIVGFAAVGVYRELQTVTRPGQSATVGLGAFHETIPPQRFAAFAVNDAVLTHSHALTAIYLPGALLEMPLSLATTAPEEWYPRRLDEWTQRALWMPVLSMPAWWMIGLAAEALLGRRRLRWPAVFLGSVLCALLAFVLAGFLLGAGAASGWVYAGLAMWIALFAALPAVAIEQVRRRRSSVAAATALQRGSPQSSRR